MPSIAVFDNLLKNDIDLLSDGGFLFNKYDTLASEDDLSLLFDTLSSFRDSQGNSAVLTPVCVVANPDFEKIRQSDFKSYYYESFTESLKKVKGCEKSFGLWQEGIRNRLFMPQFHGREHLNVKVWMRSLTSKHERTVTAFDNGLWGISTAMDPGIGVEFQAAFDFLEVSDLQYHREVVVTGLDLFEELFGYRACYFVPPNGPYSSKLDPVFSNEGIRLICVPKLRTEPVGLGKSKKRLHWLGQKNVVGIRYLIRNCLFEPVHPGRDWVDSCLNDIAVAFRWHKPAIISSHRINYVGRLYKENRDNGLRQLRILLNTITKKWPDAEFLTTAELADTIENG